MKINLKLEVVKELNTDVKYRNLIGALLYINSRSDIAFSVNYLNRFQNCYDETHFKYAMSVKIFVFNKEFNVLKLTYYTNQNVDIMDCFVDAD